MLKLTTRIHEIEAFLEQKIPEERGKWKPILLSLYSDAQHIETTIEKITELVQKPKLLHRGGLNPYDLNDVAKMRKK